ncbi:MAG: hypothetical protein HS104_32240 [Polyangiaceae bacterium]|nr:hypothetical protein [Polyangiaceae bacterium]MCE7892587.1 hypothetical protein [Sorangiineae bacterium PRO1]MCL4749156.1 hypothetical protein [Myxococcales bacterium]
MRWLVLVLLAFSLIVGCDMNPQPEVPGADEPEAAGGASGAAGAPGADLEVPSANDDDPGRAVDPDPTDYSGGLQAGGKTARPDGGVREVPDAATDAQSPPPVVVAN